MPNTVFNVSSNRIWDIKLNPGTTVGQLRQILREAGYDVVEATAHVDREEGGTLHGFVENCVLQEGDGVRFTTFVSGLPASDYDNAQADEDCECHCGACEARRKEHTKSATENSSTVLKPGDRRLVIGNATVTLNGDTVTIVISKNN